MKPASQKAIAVGTALLCFSVMTFAQADANALLTSAKTTVMGVVNLIVSIVQIIMGLVGAIMLVTNLAKYLKGDPSSNDALMKVGGGLLIAVVIIQVIRMTLLQGA